MTAANPNRRLQEGEIITLYLAELAPKSSRVTVHTTTVRITGQHAEVTDDVPGKATRYQRRFPRSIIGTDVFRSREDAQVALARKLQQEMIGLMEREQVVHEALYRLIGEAYQRKGEAGDTNVEAGDVDDA